MAISFSRTWGFALVCLVGLPGEAPAQDPDAAAALVKRVVRMLNDASGRATGTEALALLERGKALFGDDELWVWWGMCGRAHAVAGNVTECFDAFGKAKAGDTEGIFTDHASRAVITLADTRMEAGDLREAIKILQDHPDLIVEDDKFVYYGRQGVCHEWLREEDQALAFYDKAIALKPDAWYRKYRAKLHHLFGRWDQAREDLDHDRELKAEEQQSGRPHPLRVVVDGPYRARWPHAWPKLELRSRYGHFQIVSTAGLTATEIDAIERDAAQLDPSRSGDASKLRSLLKPTKEIETIATLMELIRSEYMKTVNMRESAWPKGRIFKVFFFDTQSDFQAFGGAMGGPKSESTLGYYAPQWSYLTLFNAPGGDQIYGLSEESMDTLFHEGWHQFFDVISEKPPVWLNEGLAELVGPSKVLAGGRKINLAPLIKERRRPEYPSRYEVIKAAARSNGYIKFRKFFRTTRKEWNEGDVNLYYSQSWAVCYYAMRGGNSAFQKDFLRLFWGTTEGRTQEDLLEEYFPDAKLDAYEKAWVAYMRKL